jgi:hypothetical protein
VKLPAKFLKVFWFFIIVDGSFSLKCKNVHISSNISPVIMSPNPNVKITLFMVKYEFRTVSE